VRRAAWRWARTHPGMVVLLVLPLAVFGLPMLWGRLFLDGDGLIQNFPLRVLVGQDLRAGTLPLLDPYLYAGTPLLGGFNAGAAYPATWLFGLLPSGLAWTLNLTLVYDTALAGTYLFLRRQPVSQAAATIGAATFALAGFLSAQIVHIDLIEGASWLPWMLLAVHGLTVVPPGGTPDAAWRRGRRWWAGVLAVGTGLSILAGGPESFIDGGTLAAIYLVYRLFEGGLLVRRNRAWSVRSLVSIAAGVATGVLLGAAQLLPGLAFVGQSQRGSRSYAFFTSGSLPVRTLGLLVSPFALGTNQTTSGSYVGQYNFPEVTSYVGILALIAACTLPAARWRRRPEARRWWIWYVVMAIGVLAALGGQTPFDYLLYVIPGVNGQRLLNRNLLLVDFSMAVLLAWWVHLLLERRAAPTPAPGPAGTPPPAAAGRSRGETVLTCAPLGLVTLSAVLLWTASRSYIHALGGQFPVSDQALGWLRGIGVAEVVIAGAATWLVLAAGRLRVDTLRRLLVAVLVVDLGLFSVLSVHPPVPTSVAHAQGTAARQLAQATGDGRFLVYDRDGIDAGGLVDLGQTDLSVPNHLPSGQGYAALVGNDYYQATGAHYQEDLTPSTLAGTVWDRLNVTVLLSLPSYFVTPASGSPPTAYPFPQPTSDPTDAVPASLGDQAVGADGGRRQWYLGGVLTVRQASLPVRAGDAGRARVGLLEPAGGTEWLPAADVRVAPGGLAVDLPAPTAAAGLVVQNPGTAPFRVGIPTVATTEAGTVLLNGRLQAWVTTPHWTYTGTIGSFGVFRNAGPRGWAWAEGPGGGAPPAGTTVSTAAPARDGSQQVTIHATGPARVVRSMAWATGWHATVTPVDPGAGRPTGPSRAATVERTGILQVVAVPAAGTYRLSFTYHSTSAVVGIAVSALTGLALLAWSVAEVVGTRRRRRPARAS